jgi:hypothetical protein
MKMRKFIRPSNQEGLFKRNGNPLGFMPSLSRWCGVVNCVRLGRWEHAREIDKKRLGYRSELLSDPMGLPDELFDLILDVV